MARARKPRVRDRNSEAEQARLNILDIAAQEFADKGLAGARVDEIADKINSSKRMIYYYFGGKEELYRAVLEQAYAKIRAREAAANYAAMRADEALKLYVGHTFDYHAEHPEFVRLVMNENIHYGAHIGAVPGLKERNHSVIATLQAILDKGVKEGRFRTGLDPGRAAHDRELALLLQRFEPLHLRRQLRRRHGDRRRWRAAGAS